MQTFSSQPRRAAAWLVLALGGLLLQGCAKSAAPASQPRLFESDLQGAAKRCTAPKPQLAPGKETAVEMKLGNDGGWCAIVVASGGAPYDTGLLTELPAHGSVYIHPVGNATRIDYTPDARFSGSDTFVVKLLPGSPVLRVSVAVTR